MSQEGRPISARIRFAESQIAVLAARYRAGASIEHLAHHAGYDRRVLRRMLVEAGVRLRPRPQLPAEQTAWVITQYQRGATLRQIAELTGYSYSSIRRRLIHAEIPLRPPGTRQPPPDVPRARTAATGS